MSDTAPRSTIKVFLQIENRLLREALLRLLRKRADITVVGQSDSGELPADRISLSSCDVLVVSYETSAHSDLLQNGSIRRAGCKALLIGMDATEEQFLDAVRSGVMGCLLKDASASDVVNAIRALYRGEAVCPPQFCLTLFRLVAEIPAAAAQEPAHRPDLTLRQQQLVALVARGLTNKEIAAHLNLSEFTVRNHIHRILKQVDADNRSEAVEAVRAYGYTLNA
ncbi:MAG TPA: response regulator transcription factor [Candidatus Acidoferrum sp.]|nr:response regulator transcription factor [Candidatus Acidoferrum sp.]